MTGARDLILCACCGALITSPTALCAECRSLGVPLPASVDTIAQTLTRPPYLRRVTHLEQWDTSDGSPMTRQTLCGLYRQRSELKERRDDVTCPECLAELDRFEALEL